MLEIAALDLFMLIKNFSLKFMDDENVTWDW